MKKKITKAGDSKKNAKSAGTKAKKSADKMPKRVSAINAAVEVLKKGGKPMGCKELVAAMSEQGLWKSPEGKTPQATLYSAIVREIQKAGSKARFKKVDRGQFEFRSSGT